MHRYILVLILFLLFEHCSPPEKYHMLSGETMGTYYKVTYEGVRPDVVDREISELLLEFNQSLSTYIPNSFISNLNNSQIGIPLPETELYFEPVLIRSKELKTLTEGRLNVAIMPLVKYWRDNSTKIDTSIAMNVKQLVDSSSFTIEITNGEKFVTKSNSKSRLDFSSLAKGYGIDVIAQYLTGNGIQNYLIDIGGESRAKGVNSIQQKWTLAINKPIEGAGLAEAEVYIQLDDRSIATSGTYRQFYEKDGKKIAHIIDPISGYSIESDLLSATVIADDCMTADGLATALMVYNLDEAKVFLAKNKYKACLLYDEDGHDPLEKYYANGFEDVIIEID